MKEILKYLRQTNSYTQAAIARKLEISRQSYIKYENGEVVPGDKVIRELSIIYGVTEDFIRKNEIPKFGNAEKECVYEINHGCDLLVASPSVAYGAPVVAQEKVRQERRVFDGFFDGAVVRILDSIEKLKLEKGQMIKLYVEEVDEEEDMRQRKEALEKFMSFKGTIKRSCNLKPDEDPYYKEEYYKALEEKYGSFEPAD